MSKQTSRRRTLKLIGGSAVGLTGLTGTTAAEENTTETTEKEEGKSVEVPDSYENVSSFTVYEGQDLEWDVPEDKPLTTQSHCPGNGGLHWTPGFTWEGVTFEFNVKDCPDTCEWEVTVTALNQTYGLVTSDDCETNEYLSVGVKPLKFSGSVSREQVVWGSTAMVIVEADITVEYYHPTNGWQEKDISWELEGEE
ncbi:hypothetical protein [Halorussus amylolyticus]|uniref:hypothetical protein n=1 Tax=Halorussus amylolyticus TaxID=1126242 RepID=UPI00138ECC3C|nr:hypothetical protein [Halorussus amylolyticus]